MGDHCRGQLQNKVPHEDDRIKLILFSVVPSVVLVSVAQFSNAISFVFQIEFSSLESCYNSCQIRSMTQYLFGI